MLSLGLDIGNAKIKLCLGQEGQQPRLLSTAIAHSEKRRYQRRSDFERGVPEAIGGILSSANGQVPDIVVLVTSAGYAFETFDESLLCLIEILQKTIPQSPIYCLSGSLELVSAKEIINGSVSMGPIHFSNPNGAAYLARRLKLFSENGSGLCLDTGGQTTGTLVVHEPMDPMALGKPDQHIDHRVKNGKLVWIGAETTPLEFLAHEVILSGQRYPIVPRGISIENAMIVLKRIDERRFKKLALWGLVPSEKEAKRALCDAIGLDPSRVSENDILELANQMVNLAVERLARELMLAKNTAPPIAQKKAAAFGVGAQSLGLPALMKMGYHREDIVLGGEVLPAEYADAASCFGAYHAGLEWLRQGVAPVYGAKGE